jgi:hypothetical protein
MVAPTNRLSPKPLPEIETMITTQYTTTTHTAPKAYRAHLHDTAIILTKIDGRIVILDTDSRYIRDFQIDDATFCTVLGEIGIADTQAIRDGMAGGAAQIACSRLMEVR